MATTTTTTIQTEALVSANVRVSNSVDEEHTFDITANVNVHGGTQVGNVDSGQVVKDGGVRATFNSWGEGMLNISYQQADADERQTILTAVNQYLSDLRTYFADNPIGF